MTSPTKQSTPSPMTSVKTGSLGSAGDFKEDPFKRQDVFAGGAMTSVITNNQADPFQNDDPFQDSESHHIFV